MLGIEVCTFRLLRPTPPDHVVWAAGCCDYASATVTHSIAMACCPHHAGNKSDVRAHYHGMLAQYGNTSM